MKNSKYILCVILNEVPIAFYRGGVKNLVERGRKHTIPALQADSSPDKNRRDQNDRILFEIFFLLSLLKVQS